MSKKTLIVGGVAGGASTAARLRRLDENAEIILFEKGGHISFANCGLPYYIGGIIPTRKQLLIIEPELMKTRYRIDVRVFHEVLSIDKDQKTIKVKDLQTGSVYFENYDKLVLATGSSPFVPPIEGIRENGIFTLWNMEDTDKIKSYLSIHKPKRAIVAGGGFIGLEMAENLKESGIDVTLIELQSHVMPALDADISKIIHKELSEHNVKLMLNRRLISCQKEKNSTSLIAALDTGESLETDILILSLGVRPNSQLAYDAGLALNKKGGIVVTSDMRTNDPDIFAVGDVAEVTHYISGEKTMVPLAGPANKQGRICADNIAGISSKYGGSMASSIVKIFNLTVASTGLNEKQLKNMGKLRGTDYFIAKTHPFSHADYYPYASQMTIKVLYLSDGTIVGAAAAGYEGVDKKIDIIATAIHFHGKISDLSELELCYAPPFSSAKDPVNMLGFIGEKQLSHLCNFMSWDEYEDLDKSKVTLLDVRTHEEYAEGSVDGALHIPLDDLRKHLDHLKKSHITAVFCGVGLRAYIACRILQENGFCSVNLSGGYLSYQQTHEKFSSVH